MSRFTDPARPDMGKKGSRLVPDNPPKSADRAAANVASVHEGTERDVQAGPPLTGPAARADRQLHGQEGIGRIGALNRRLSEKTRVTPWHYVGGVVFLIAVALIVWWWMS